MKIHKEGAQTILIIITLLGLINAIIFYFATPGIGLFVATLSILILAFILHFFRSPSRSRVLDPSLILAPADGKVVVLEEVFESEFLKIKCKQISVFMSPLNVHVNWNPCSGKVVYDKYHPGKYLVAWHPKSSSLNERTTVVYELKNQRILIRQIAGAVARRIVNYLKEGDLVVQGDEMGFIKFGSRVDILVPLKSEILVSLNTKVKGTQTPIARLID
ncbi:MAG: phosphatidylserine decarboxylase family protein [Saprospiraceae bacterium]|nr:phosphatidylserine decarboxylase family protein [Saprospiraceae bacterium]